MTQLLHNLNYAAAVLLMLIGLYAVAVRPNAVKKVMGLVLIESGVFTFFVSMGIVGSGADRIYTPGFRASSLVNPLPPVMVLIGELLAVGVVAMGLAICIRLYEAHGTLDSRSLWGRDRP